MSSQPAVGIGNEDFPNATNASLTASVQMVNTPENTNTSAWDKEGVNPQPSGACKSPTSSSISHESESLHLPQKEEPAVPENSQPSASLPDFSKGLPEDLSKIVEQATDREIRAWVKDCMDWQNPGSKLSDNSCLTKIETNSVVGSALQNKQKLDLQALETRNKTREQPLVEKVEVIVDKETQSSVETTGTQEEDDQSEVGETDLERVVVDLNALVVGCNKKGWKN